MDKSDSKVSVEEQPFLEKGSLDSEETFDLTPIERRSRPWIERHWLLYLLHLGLISVYTLGFILSIRALDAKYRHGPGLIDSPARSAIEYEVVRFEGNVHRATTYFGEPSEAKEEAWNELLGPSTVRIPAEDMERWGRADQGIVVPGGDYLGTLNVYHDLHCIRRIYRLLYPEYFFPNMTEEVDGLNRIHAQHCLDRLRQGVMCHGDISPATYYFGKLQALPLANFNSPHECVAWDKLDTWAREKSVNVFEPGLVVHPTYGPAYAHSGDIHHTGAVHDIIIDD